MMPGAAETAALDEAGAAKLTDMEAEVDGHGLFVPERGLDPQALLEGLRGFDGRGEEYVNVELGQEGQGKQRKKAKRKTKFKRTLKKLVHGAAEVVALKSAHLNVGNSESESERCCVHACSGVQDKNKDQDKKQFQSPGSAPNEELDKGFLDTALPTPDGTVCARALLAPGPALPLPLHPAIFMVPPASSHCSDEDGGDRQI